MDRCSKCVYAYCELSPFYEEKVVIDCKKGNDIEEECEDYEEDE